MAKASISSTLKRKPPQTAPISEQAIPSEAADEKAQKEKAQKVRGAVQTVRMDQDLVMALKTAAMHRNMSQQDIIIKALRHDLRQELELQTAVRT